VVAVGLTTVEKLVAPVMGFDWLPELPTNHWYVNGPEPVGETESVLDCPDEIDEGDAFGAGADGGTHAPTVTVTAGLSATGAHWPVTRTQYEVVLAGLTVTDELVWPLIGLVVFPEFPTYHW
jgi:hypothetical protein